MACMLCRKAAQPSGDRNLVSFTRGAAVLLGARGVTLTSRRVSSLARLAQSLTGESLKPMGRIEALEAAGMWLVPRFLREEASTAPQKRGNARLPPQKASPERLPARRDGSSPQLARGRIGPHRVARRFIGRQPA